jgi:hypothetical protein
MMDENAACTCWHTIDKTVQNACPRHGDGSSRFREVPDYDDIVYRLKKRAEIRRQIPNRKSVTEGKPDRIAELLEEAAAEIEVLRARVGGDKYPYG